MSDIYDVVFLLIFFLLFIITYTSTNYTKLNLKKNKDIYNYTHRPYLLFTADRLHDILIQNIRKYFKFLLP